MDSADGSATSRGSRPPVAVIGAGSIGLGWSLVFARAGHGVRVFESAAERRKVAGDELRDRLGALDRYGLLEEPVAAIGDRVIFEDDLSAALIGAVHVQECISERLEPKRSLFERLGREAGPDTVLASSSSALMISQIVEGLAGRERSLIVHPANPPHLLPVVELVPAPFTGEAVVERTRRLLVGAGMQPVVVRKEIEGFVFNRLQGAVLREAYCLVRDGVASVEEIDQIMRDGLGRRWSVVGPFETADLNTPGGIEAHAARMGPAYARMGAARGQDDPWTDDLVAKVTAERRDLLPLDGWDDRITWRDQVLMMLAKTWIEAETTASESRSESTEA